MTKDNRTIQPWQIERAKQRGSARARRAAIAMLQPIETLEETRARIAAGNTTSCVEYRDLSPNPPHGSKVPADRPTLSQSQGDRRARGIPSATEHVMPNSKQLKQDDVDGLREVATPQGQRMVLNLSPALLNPGAGRRCIRTGQSEKCGLMWGQVNRGFRHPNYKDPSKTSIRWHGSFGYQRADGMIGTATTVYLTGVVERQLLSLGIPVIGEGDPPPPAGFAADFSVEIWAEPDEENTPKPTAAGFQYAVFNRADPPANVNMLAPPEVRALLPVPATRAPELLGYDPETGELDDDHFGQPHHGHEEPAQEPKEAAE